LNFVALPIPDIIGGTQKIRAVPGYAHAPFSPKFLMFLPNLKFVASRVPEIIAIGVLVRIANPNLGEEEPVVGLGSYRSKERW